MRSKKYRILSNRKLSELELRQIQDILLVSACPNESLRNSIDGCVGLRSTLDDEYAGTIRINSVGEISYEVSLSQYVVEV